MKTPKEILTERIETFNAADAGRIADMVCIPENIFTDGDRAILEWKDPKNLRGCGFFQIKNEKIVFQRGCRDKLSFHRLYGIPPEKE